MKELTLDMQMNITGGGVTTIILCVVIGTALYKIYTSSSGRVSIPKIVSLEWRK